VPIAFRPTFAVDITGSSREIIDQLAARLGAGPFVLRRTRPPGGGRDDARLEQDHLMLTVVDTERHFWSPWLAIEVTSRGERVHVAGKFSPHPSVWTGFTFGYLGLGLVLLLSLVVAGSSVLVPGSGQPWTLWVAGGALVAMIGMWWASQVGQRLARHQMEQLRGALEAALADVTAPPG